MNSLTYKTISANNSTVERKWWIVDATDLILGRMCTEITNVLRGKNKAYFTPHVDCGDYVIVINAEKIRLTGKKMKEKQYVRYTGYPGGQKFATPEQLLQSKPAFVIENAVKGMIPKNKLGSQVYTKLFVYAGGEHPHTAQKPEQLKIKI